MTTRTMGSMIATENANDMNTSILEYIVIVNNLIAHISKPQIDEPIFINMPNLCYFFVNLYIIIKNYLPNDNQSFYAFGMITKSYPNQNNAIDNYQRID